MPAIFSFSNNAGWLAKVAAAKVCGCRRTESSEILLDDDVTTAATESLGGAVGFFVRPVVDVGGAEEFKATAITDAGVVAWGAGSWAGEPFFND